MGSSEARLRSYDSILPLESIEHLKLKIIHTCFFLHDYEAVAWTMQRWLPSTSTGRKHEKTTKYLMKVYENALSRFLLASPEEVTQFALFKRIYKLFHLTDVKPACTLDPEKRTSISDVWMPQATATAKAIVEAKACISARQVQPQMGDHVTLGTDW